MTSLLIKTIVKYWPSINPSKEVLFLNELEEVILILFIMF
jgi:hypothetical protein